MTSNALPSYSLCDDAIHNCWGSTELIKVFLIFICNFPGQNELCHLCRAAQEQLKE